MIGDGGEGAGKEKMRDLKMIAMSDTSARQREIPSYLVRMLYKAIAPWVEPTITLLR